MEVDSLPHSDTLLFSQSTHIREEPDSPLPLLTKEENSKQILHHTISGECQ